MDKLRMESKEVSQENIERIRELFPNCVTEILDNGNLRYAIDFDVLKQELSSEIVEGNEERYQFTWPDKRKAINLANTPTTSTLRPCREESVDFDNTKNLYIEGDNLEIVKCLRETYLGKVKLVYMDPPYNAGADLLYKNKFEMTDAEFRLANFDLNEDGYIMSLNSDSNGRYHTDWINMMYSRLKLVRPLLTEDGCVVLAIDDNELINLVKICDDIFGENNRIGIVTVVHKPEGRNQEKNFATSNEFALFYAKNYEEFSFRKVILDEKNAQKYDKSDSVGKYVEVSFIAKNHGRSGYDKNLRENNPNKYFPIYVSKDLKNITLDKKDGYIAVYPNTKTQERTWKYIKETCIKKINDGEVVARIDKDEIKLFEKYREDKGQLIKTHWIDTRYNAMVNGTVVLDNLMKDKTFDFPKSIYLLEDIVRLTTSNDSIILDMFSGSATMAQSVFLSNMKDLYERKFILLQLPWYCDKKSNAYKAGYKNICEIGKERIRRAGKKIKEEPDSENIDTGFRVLKLASSNMEEVYYTPKELQKRDLFSLIDNVKPDRTSEDLLFQVMLECNVTLDAKIEKKEINGKEVFYVNDGYLVACFDKDIDEDIITEIAKQNPVYFVIKGSQIENDCLIDNFDQLFKNYSPDTIRRML
ncbi:MAG: site-specific DNA-methyltransferase [Bacteroidales bacterium]|nr:site-specific DNA-methyltransferase [Bacteroidales bacterium]